MIPTQFPYVGWSVAPKSTNSYGKILGQEIGKLRFEQALDNNWWLIKREGYQLSTGTNTTEYQRPFYAVIKIEDSIITAGWQMPSGHHPQDSVNALKAKIYGSRKEKTEVSY